MPSNTVPRFANSDSAGPRTVGSSRGPIKSGMAWMELNTATMASTMLNSGMSGVSAGCTSSFRLMDSSELPPGSSRLCGGGAAGMVRQMKSRGRMLAAKGWGGAAQPAGSRRRPTRLARALTRADPDRQVTGANCLRARPVRRSPKPDAKGSWAASFGTR